MNRICQTTEKNIFKYSILQFFIGTVSRAKDGQNQKIESLERDAKLPVWNNSKNLETGLFFACFFSQNQSDPKGLTT